MYKKAIISMLLLEIVFLFVLQYVYGNVLDIGSLIGLAVLLIFLNLFLIHRLSGKRKQAVFVIQIILLIFIPVYSMMMSPAHTYESAAEKVEQNLESSDKIIKNRKVILMENEDGSIKKGYLFSMENNSDPASYAFNPWNGDYQKID
ncbi:hypothetical protein [Saccharibacillus endophyticus]|uniref:Maltose/maltodextrin transport system permease protein n=1 Tax=Saccharibacillus endophyticus TaxID=2060666 RepID=A0ABQ1ZWE2_9BACL|nr:hypothetical protein [Saccharibacillus endophyticus]GGH80304.1 hypothetical protein GCM10007362_28410 [Saccharibacillus endophyticus]